MLRISISASASPSEVQKLARLFRTREDIAGDRLLFSQRPVFTRSRYRIGGDNRIPLFLQLPHIISQIQENPGDDLDQRGFAGLLSPISPRTSRSFKRLTPESAETLPKDFEIFLSSIIGSAKADLQINQIGSSGLDIYTNTGLVS
jgi:hypothetical protein